MSALKSLTVTQDGFAFDVTTGDNFTLNPCGKLVLQKLQDGETKEQITQFLAHEFGIAYSRATRDITDFCQQLHTLGFKGTNL